MNSAQKYFISFLLVIFVGISLSIASHREESFHAFSAVKIDIKRLDHTLLGTIDNDISPYNKKHEENFFMCRSESCEVVYSLQKPSEIKKVIIYFVGYFPKNPQDVTFKLDERPINEHTILLHCDKKSSLCTYYFVDSGPASKIYIKLDHATPKNFGIYDIQIYEGYSRNIISTLYHVLFIWPRNLPLYFVYPVLFFMLLITPFAIVFGRVRDLIMKEKIIFLIYLISIVFLSGLMYIRDYPQKQTNPITINDFYAKDTIPSMVSYNTYETDYLIPYQTAINFERGALNEKIGIIYNISDRTPLISLLLIPFLKVFGQNMFVYQMFTVMMGNLFIISFYFLSRLFVNQTKSAAIALTLSFSHFFTFITPYWPQKTIALFFVFSSLYYIFKQKPSYRLSGIHMLIAFLLHMYIVVYFASFGLFIATKEYLTSHSLKKVLRSLFLFLIPTMFGFLAWAIFSFSIGQNQGIIWHIIAERSWSKSAESIKTSSKIAPASLSQVASQSQFWKDKFFNFIDLFTYQNHKGYPTRLFDFYKLTIPGALGLLATISSLAAIMRLVILKRKSYILYGFFFIMLPIFFTVILHGFYIRTGVMSYLLGIIPLLLLFISKMFNTKYFSIVSLFFIGESLYLYFIQDELANKRLALFTQNIPQFFFLVVIGVMVVCILILFLSYRQARLRARSD